MKLWLMLKMMTPWHYISKMSATIQSLSMRLQPLNILMKMAQLTINITFLPFQMQQRKLWFMFMATKQPMLTMTTTRNIPNLSHTKIMVFLTETITAVPTSQQISYLQIQVLGKTQVSMMTQETQLSQSTTF